ncbi:MAG: hypothetical protein K0U40_06710 [Betaproteobacteria bacterium]|nr:hypothetical protein [Betaproteobacteria bacterium]
MGAYQPLLNIAVEHAYFADLTCKSLEFVPTDASIALINKTGLILKSSQSGIAVFYENDKMDILRLHAADHFVLTFKVFPKDPYFFRYTIPSIQKDNFVLFFSNQQVVQDAEGKQMLHHDHYVSEQAFTQINSELFEDIFDRKDYLVKPAMIVQVQITDDDAGLCSENLEADLRNYYIRFSTNEAFWKYYILGDLSRRSLYIADLDNEVQFENVGIVTLPGRREAIMLQSSVAINMQEQHHHRFQLRESGSMGDKVLIKRMPNASISQMNGEIIGSRMENVSEIFIN